MMPVRSEKNVTANRRETFGFVIVLIVCFVVSITTTITLATVIYKLRLIPGFSFFDFAEDQVVFHRDAYIDRIQLAKNKISRLSRITGNIEVKSGDERVASYLRLNEDGIKIMAPRGFEVRCPTTGKRLFPFDFSAVPLPAIKTLSVPSGVRDVKLIRSPVDEDLSIFGKDRIRIRGNRGVHFEEGVYMDMKSFKSRIASPDTPANHSQSTVTIDDKVPQFHLCVCAKNGRLFRIPVKDSTSSCADARFPQSENPCAE